MVPLPEAPWKSPSPDVMVYVAERVVCPVHLPLYRVRHSIPEYFMCILSWLAVVRSTLALIEVHGFLLVTPAQLAWAVPFTATERVVEVVSLL